MVVFRDDKSVEDEQKAWEFWHSRQHSHKQRVIDIGKSSASSRPACGILKNAPRKIIPLYFGNLCHIVTLFPGLFLYRYKGQSRCTGLQYYRGVL